MCIDLIEKCPNRGKAGRHRATLEAAKSPALGGGAFMPHPVAAALQSRGNSIPSALSGKYENTKRLEDRLTEPGRFQAFKIGSGSGHTKWERIA